MVPFLKDTLREDTPLERIQIFGHKYSECMQCSLSPKDIFLIRTQLFGRRSVPIRGGLLWLLQSVIISMLNNNFIHGMAAKVPTLFWKQKNSPKYKSCFSRTYSQDRSGFQHFRHEGGYSFQLAVTSTNSGQYTVDYRYVSLWTRYKGPQLGHQNNGSNLKTPKRMNSSNLV